MSERDPSWCCVLACTDVDRLHDGRWGCVQFDRRHGGEDPWKSVSGFYYGCVVTSEWKADSCCADGCADGSRFLCREKRGSGVNAI